jgi:O-antigen/teichoic acid export membrane protein
MLKNISANWIQTLLTVVVTYVLMPFSLHALGREPYGTWILITAITSYLSLLIIGVPAASVRFIAKHAAAGDLPAMNRAIANCAALYLFLGVVAFVTGLGLFAWFEAAYAIPAGLVFDAKLSFSLVILYVSTGFLLQLPYGIMSAHEDFVARNLVMIGSLLIRLVLTLALLSWRPSMAWLALVQLLCSSFEFVVAMTICRKRYPGVVMSPFRSDYLGIRQILAFSVFVLFLQVGNQLGFQTDSIVIGRMMAIDQIPFFSVASSLALYLMEFVISIAAVVMPAAVRLETQGRHEELRQMYLKWSKIVFSLALLPGLYLIVLGPRFISWWIGDAAFEKPAGDVLIVLMTANLVFLPMRGVSMPLLMGIGKPAGPALAFMLTGVVNLGLSIVLARPFGLVGVALGTAIPNIAFALGVMVLTCRQIQVPIWQFARYVWLKAVVGTIPSMALLWWARSVLDVRGFLPLFVAGLGMVGTFALTWLLFVYRGDPYEDPLGRLRKLMPTALGRT